MKKIFGFLLVFYISSTCVLHTQWLHTNGPVGYPINCLTISGINLFAGTERGGIFLTTNNGTSWTSINNGLSAISVYGIVKNGSNLFATTWGSGIVLSTNNGTSWTEVNAGLVPFHSVPPISLLLPSPAQIFLPGHMMTEFSCPLITVQVGLWSIMV